VGMRQLHQLEGPYEPLARRNAIELSGSRWEYDVRRLVAAIELAIAGTGQSIGAPFASTATATSSSGSSSGPVEYRPSPASREVIDAVLGGRRASMVWLAVSVAVTVVSVIAALLALTKL
jgi:hypothetical protein